MECLQELDVTMEVHVRQHGTKRALNLDQVQLDLFSREFARTIRRRHVIGVPPGIAPDCEIIVKRPKSSDVTYDLYGRAVLVERSSHKAWQFYFGLLLLEWLYR